MLNSLGREIPEYVEGIGILEPFQGALTKLSKGWMDEPTIPAPNKAYLPHQSKLCKTLEEAIIRSNPHNGMTVSFHHHLRNGDILLVQTLTILHNMGIREVTLASSSLNECHDPILPFLKDGTVTRIFSSGIRSQLGRAIALESLDTPVVIHSHGGRVRSIHTGKIQIDLAIIAASAADCEGNATARTGNLLSALSAMPLLMPDMPKQVIVVTDNLVDFPCIPLSISQNFIDHVVLVDSIGDASKIATGTTRITNSPMDLRIAKLAADVIEHSGFFIPGFAFQVGAGGASLAVAKFIREKMKAKGLKGSFMLGGITSYCVDMLNEGLFETIFDVQSFDAVVSNSLLNNRRHIEIPAALYANPFNCGCITNKIDVVVLGALEIDVDFNVNVITRSEGNIRGHQVDIPDTASVRN